jgi:uncharacterized protein
MSIAIIAGIITLLFTTLLTIAGEGAAIILIPTFIALGIDVRVAMATALLLNTLAMVVACPRYFKNGLIMFKVGLPILIAAALCSPIGAYVSKQLDRQLLLILFVAFLLFASGMMFFYRPQKQKSNKVEQSKTRQVIYGAAVGVFAGFMAGLLGVGGGNFILPMLVYFGFDPKKASATTAFIVIFSSFSGFLGHATVGNIDFNLLLLTASGSVGGALIGSWLMSEKLKSNQVKLIIGSVLLVVAAKMLWNLLW